MRILLEEQPVVEIVVHDPERILKGRDRPQRVANLVHLNVAYGINHVNERERAVEQYAHHELAATTISILLADEIAWRIGQAVAVGVRALHTGESLGSPGEPWFDVSPGTQSARPLPNFLKRVVALASIANDDEYCIFEVEKFELGSIKETLKIVMVVVNIGAAPAPAVTTSGIQITLTAIAAAAGIANVGWDVYTYRNDRHRTEVAELAQYYAEHASRNDWAPVQNELSQMRYYRDRIDGFTGTNTIQAIADFSKDEGLPDGLLPNDPRFFRALAFAVIERRP